jgi:hypothetical protein
MISQIGVDMGKDGAGGTHGPTDMEETKTVTGPSAKEKNADYIVSVVKDFLRTGTGRSLALNNSFMKRLKLAIDVYEQNLNPKIGELSGKIVDTEQYLRNMIKERDEMVKNLLREGK